jgi:hypothetical protein
MQSIWWLYLLTFVFGYYTCKTFYFIREMRTGVVLLKLSHALSLFFAARGMENLQYAKSLRVIEMSKTNESKHNIDAFKINFDKEIEQYKRKAVRDILEHHPRFYKDIVEFHDWDSAMIYLNTEGLEYIQQFLKER